MLYTPLQCIFVPFRRCFGKADRLEHLLALRVKGVNIGLYAAHPLFLGPSAAWPVHSGGRYGGSGMLCRLRWRSRRHSAARHRRLMCCYIQCNSTPRLRLGSRTCGVAGPHRRGGIPVIHLLDDVRVLIPGQRYFVVSVIGYQPDFTVYPSICHVRIIPAHKSPESHRCRSQW